MASRKDCLDVYVPERGEWPIIVQRTESEMWAKNPWDEGGSQRELKMVWMRFASRGIADFLFGKVVRPCVNFHLIPGRGKMSTCRLDGKEYGK